MKYTYLTLTIILFCLTVSAQRMSRQEYIQRYQQLAIEEMIRSGIPASITIAQGILESNNGNSELARKSNNHFGIKCKKGWKGKKVYYDDDHRNECFRSYKTAEESYIDHSNFLLENPRYRFLFDLKPTDYKGWAKGLKKAGYATAHDYDKRLIKIIEQEKLYLLDKKMPINQLANFEQKAIGRDGVHNALVISPFNTHKKLKINGLKAVIAHEEDSYELIAKEFGLNSWELYRYNDQVAGYRPVPQEVVYLQRKKRRASKSKPTHMVEAGESLHYISQLYGIRLKPLQRRNHMAQGEIPRPGQIIKLR